MRIEEMSCDRNPPDSKAKSPLAFGKQEGASPFPRFDNALPSAADLIDLIPVVVWSAQPDGRVDYVNDVWTHLSGCDDPSLWMQSIHPDDFEHTAQVFKASFAAGEAFEIQHRMLFLDGRYHWMLGRAKPLRDDTGTIVRWIGSCTDIDEKKKTTEKLKQSEQLFDLASKATRNIIWDHDVLTSRTTYNNALTTELGYERSQVVSDKDWWVNQVHPDDIDQLLREIANCVSAGLRNITAEYRFKIADGSYRTFIDRCTLVYDEHRNLTRMIGAMEDVTSERQATQKLRESEQLWRSLTNTMSQIAWMCDASGEMLWFNDRFYEFTGMNQREALNYGWRSMVHPDYQRDVEASFRKVLKSQESWDETFPALDKNGDSRWFLATAHPLRDDGGQVVRWLGTKTDITRQMLLSDQIKEREEQLRMATEAAKIGTWTLDLSTREGYWNEEAAAIHGRSPKVVITFEDLISYVHPDDKRIVINGFRGIVGDGEKDTEESEFRIIRPDGTVRWINVIAKKLKQFNPRHGSRVFIVGTIIDLTDRLAAQVELKNAKEAAEAASAAKTSFLANMSHEIRTPLGAILGFTDLLKDEKYSSEERALFTDTISRAGASLTKIIDDILDLSKIEAGHINLDVTEFSIRELIADSLALYSEIARKKGVALHFSMDSAVPERIVSDATRIRQILINLMGNAVKFTKEGSVSIHLQVNPCGHFDAEAKEVALCIDVKDTGIGIPKEHHSRIFEPFTQVDDSTTRNFGGTGLGLALSKRLALALGGDIDIEGEEGGCTFRLKFSATRPAASTFSLDARSDSTPEAVDLCGVSVLVAEDSPEIQFLLETILTGAGADVVLVNNGRDAIRTASKKDFDVIIMDIQMPVLDGYAATREIRAAGFRKPIIAVTAHAMAEERSRTSAAGCNHHLTKPLHPGHLLMTIRSSLGGPALSS